VVSSPRIQVALDVLSLSDALRVGEAALEAGADWLEIGKPLVEFAGISALGRIREAFPDAYLLADLMIIAGSQRYVGAAADLGLDNVTVTALAPARTVLAAIEAGRDRGISVTVDLFHVADVVREAVRYAEAGAEYLMVHLGADERGPDGSVAALADLRSVLAQVQTPVSFATYSLDEAVAATRAGAAVIVQGEPLISARDPRAALGDFISAVQSVNPRSEP
jgi:3-hexulose-6-phosphate synthase